MARPAQTIRNAAQAKWPGASVSARGRNYIVHAHPTVPGRFMLDTGIGPLHIAGSETEIDTAWTVTTGAWQYQMVTADFQAFSRDQLGVGTMYRYQMGSEFVEFQPLALNWVNDADSRQQITQPQSVMAQVVDGDTLYFPNGYGAGRHFEYQAQTARLKKILTIDSLANLPAPTVTGTPYLEIEFIINKSAGVAEWVDGAQWDRSTRVGTPGRIEYRTSGGVALWTLDLPRAWDSAGNETTGLMVLRRQGGNRLVTVRVPKAWVDAATFPIYLDPTIDAQVGASSDDATEGVAGAGNMNLDTASSGQVDSTIEYFGFRVPVTGVAGATIDVAYATYQFDVGSQDEPQGTLYAEDNAAPGTFTLASNDISGRPSTTATVSWDNANLGAPGAFNTPSLVSVVQELFDSYGASITHIVIIYQGGADAARDFNATSYDGSTTNAPKLHIEYTVGGGGVSLTVADAGHAHVVDAVVLTQHNVLAPQDTVHAHAADNVALTQHNALAVQDAVHAHAADAVALTQHHVLAVQDASHAHTAENVTLGVSVTLTVASAGHSHAADSVALTQHNVLAVADSSHGHSAEAVSLTVALVVADAVHGHTADNVVLTQHNVLVVADTSHSHAADGVALTQHNVLAVTDASHAHSADNITLELAGQLAVADSQHAHAADNVALTQHNVLAVQDSSHGHTADNIALSVSVQLEVQSATHAHTADGVSLVVMLLVASTQHSHTADGVTLTQHNVLIV